jgi:hypothetical protein
VDPRSSESESAGPEDDSAISQAQFELDTEAESEDSESEVEFESVSHSESDLESGPGNSRSKQGSFMAVTVSGLSNVIVAGHSWCSWIDLIFLSSPISILRNCADHGLVHKWHKRRLLFISIFKPDH